MRRNATISYDQVMNEWLLAESYKLGDNPTIAALAKMRHNVIEPLKQLSVTWYEADIETTADFYQLKVVRWQDWKDCTGGTYKLADVPANLHLNAEHYQDMLAKKAELEKGNCFPAKVILFGSSISSLTIIEGNHRMAAYSLFGEANGFSFLPLKVIVGISAQSYKLSMSQDYTSL